MLLSKRAGVHTQGPVTFISTMDQDAWGGSEELWSQTALRLKARGVPVRASMQGRFGPHPKALNLKRAGIDVMFRRYDFPVWRKLIGRLSGNPTPLRLQQLEGWLKANPPQLIVLNEDFGMPRNDFTGMIRANGWPYIAIMHANSEEYWPEDAVAAQTLAGLEGARRLFYVSEGNVRLAMKQTGISRDRVDIVRNTFGVPYDTPIPWPETPIQECLEMACVGRLDPRSKGQDLLIEALCSEAWRARAWRLNIYGEGRHRKLLERMARDAGLSERVLFHGHKAVSEIWRKNHVLVQMSRVEGLPITIVEALLSGRPIVTTNVAGNAELVEEGVSAFIADAPVLPHVAGALERMWESRNRLRQMGEAARVGVVREIPADPAAAFADIIMRYY